jgi:hypothetical protein
MSEIERALPANILDWTLRLYFAQLLRAFTRSSTMLGDIGGRSEHSFLFI